MTLKKVNTADINGTCLQGYVFTTYQKLVETFGEPGDNFDDYKSDAEWTLTDESGNVVTIYNWKDGPNYCGAEGIPVEQITEWHIGGRNEMAVVLVSEAIPSAKTKKGW
jgi:hypothetical protein